MTLERVLRELFELAGRLGIAIRSEPFDLRVMEGKGGLCWLRGRPVVVLDATAPVVDRVVILTEALTRFGVEPIFVPPLLRKCAARKRHESVA